MTQVYLFLKFRVISMGRSLNIDSHSTRIRMEANIEMVKYLVYLVNSFGKSMNSKPVRPIRIGTKTQRAIAKLSHESDKSREKYNTMAICFLKCDWCFLLLLLSLNRLVYLLCFVRAMQNRTLRWKIYGAQVCIRFFIFLKSHSFFTQFIFFLFGNCSSECLDNRAKKRRLAAVAVAEMSDDFIFIAHSHSF